MLLTKKFRFEASHQISNHPGKCARLHGHSWELEVTIEGRIKVETGMVMDYYEIDYVVKPFVERLDHQHLGSGWLWLDSLSRDKKVWIGPSIVGLPALPTSEALLVWIAGQLPLEFPWRTLTLSETCTCAAILHKEEFLRVTYVEPFNLVKGGHVDGKTEEGRKDAQESEEGKEDAQNG